MRLSIICSAVLLFATAATTTLLAQQATDSAKPDAAAQSSASTASENAEAAAVAAAIAKANAAAAAQKPEVTIKPSNPVAFAKKAKEAGWRAVAQGNNTNYCRDDPVVGSRFSTRRCVNETQLATLMEQADFDKDAIKQRGCGGNCGGK